MKRFIIVFLVAFVAMAANAQIQNKLFANDTIKADTNTYTSNVKVTGYSNQVIIFSFTKVDVTDSLSVAKMQGSSDNVNWFNLGGTAVLSSTTTDGTTRLYVTNPIDLYYRGFLACSTGDTVAVTNARLIIKED